MRFFSALLSILWIANYSFAQEQHGNQSRIPLQQTRIPSIFLYDANKTKGSFTSPITGRKIDLHWITDLYDLSYPELVVKMKSSGVDIAFFNTENKSGEALKVKRLNEGFSAEELAKIEDYVYGVQSAVLRRTQRTEEAMVGRDLDNASKAKVGGLALGSHGHLQGENSNGSIYLIKRARPTAPLIAINADDGGNIHDNTIHEYLHTRFFALSKSEKRKDESYSFRDILSNNRFQAEKRVAAILAEKGIKLGEQLELSTTPENLPWLKKFAIADMKRALAHVKLEFVRAQDEFDVLSTQLENRERFNLSDEKIGGYLRYLANNLNNSRIALVSALDAPVYKFALYNFGLDAVDLYQEIVKINRAANTVLDRAEFYIRQKHFEKYIPELKNFPPGYSNQAYR